MRTARRSRAPLLNPYVVVADVAINLLLIVLICLFITSHAPDAFYSRRYRKMVQSLDPHSALRAGARATLRRGDEALFVYDPSRVFGPTGIELTPFGRLMVQDLAILLVQFNGVLKDARITVTSGTDVPGEVDLQRARHICSYLADLGVGIRLVASGRTQEKTGGDPRSLDIVLTYLPWNSASPRQISNSARESNQAG